MEELSEFYARVSGIVSQRPRSAAENSTASAVGSCKDYGHPGAEPGATIVPDCHHAEGCFFCDKFAVHADEQDVRKLASCLHCIGRTTHLSESKEHHEAIYGPVIKRIETILHYVADLSDTKGAMVIRVRAEVEEDGELDPYWARKLDFLIDLGVVRA